MKPFNLNGALNVFFEWFSHNMHKIVNKLILLFVVWFDQLIR
jgi:hypothetical protein